MRKIILLILAIFCGLACFAQVKVQRLLTENQVNPLSIDAIVPRFSWQLDAGDKRDVMQTAYEIKVVSYSYLKKGRHGVWSTGKVMSDQSVYVPYKGAPLVSGQKYYWQVRVWDNMGKAS
ncbi:MAG TPA: alpha-L-rhamnosidase, partial [Mucilaginibacter sp.]